jgi:hypothetical protein
VERAPGVKAAEMRSIAACLTGPAQANAFQAAQDNEDAAAAAVLNAADVVASTCIGSGEKRLDGQAFDICVVDEASQVTEPASLVAILQVRPKQCTFVFVWGHAGVKGCGTGCYAVSSGMEYVATGFDDRLYHGEDTR